MERPPWRWNLGFLATSAAVVLCAFVIVAAFALVVAPRLPWPAVMLAVVVVAGAGTLVAAAYVPVGVAITEDALHLRYLRHQTVIPWRDVTGILCTSDHVSIKTAGRRIRLEHPGTVIVAGLLRAARRHGIKGEAAAPREFSDREPTVPPPMP